MRKISNKIDIQNGNFYKNINSANVTLPSEKGVVLSRPTTSPDAFKNRSGLNTSGSGQTSGSIWAPYSNGITWHNEPPKLPPSPQPKCSMFDFQSHNNARSFSILLSSQVTPEQTNKPIYLEMVNNIPCYDTVSEYIKKCIEIDLSQSLSIQIQITRMQIKHLNSYLNRNYLISVGSVNCKKNKLPDFQMPIKYFLFV